MSPSTSKEQLEAVIDGILGDMVAIPVKQLPDRLIKYMQQHGYDVITPEECEEVREYISENNLDIDLNGEDVVQFLISMRDRPKDASVPATSNQAQGSSDSSTDEEDKMATVGAGGSRRPRSAKTIFPGGDPFMMPATLTSSTDTKPPTRQKKLSDSSSDRFSARGELGVASKFSRPSVGHSRRRSSSRKVSMRSDDGDSSRQGSGVWSSSSNPQSPLSAALDHSSFHNVLRSPTDRDLDGVDDSVLLELPQAIIMEKDKEISELRRQHAQESSQAQSTISVMEDEVAEMQRKMEEAFDQFAVDKKDMKVLHDRLIQDERARMEAELEELRRQLEAAKTELSRGSQSWGVQQAKLKELTEAVLDKEREMREMQSRLEQEIELRQDAQAAADRSEAYTTQLARELEVSRDAEHQLKLQKLENQHLQLTIENVNREYEQLQIQLEPPPGGGHSGPVTLTRNHGVAISNELRDATRDDEGVRERVIETVVTRTIKVSAPSANGETRTETVASETTYADVSTETDPVIVTAVDAVGASEVQAEAQAEASNHHLEEALKSPPAYSAAPDPEEISAVLEAAHPRHTPCSSSLEEEDYELLADAIGVRCRVVEDAIAVRRAALDKAGHRRKLARRSAGLYTERYSWIAYSATAFLVGAMIGGHLFVKSHHHGGFSARDISHFSSMNSLRTVGGEGFPVSGSPLLGWIGRYSRVVAEAGWVPT